MSVQPRKLGMAVALIAGFALVAADEGWAGRGHGRSHGGSHPSGLGARSSGPSVGVPAPRAGLGVKPFPPSLPASGSSHPPPHPAPAGIFIRAPFLFWSWPYRHTHFAPPYYYGPD